MNICLMCDLHLPFDKNALQYDVLDWAIADIVQKSPDCVIFAGDITCDGNPETHKTFLQKMQGLTMPFFFIPGNSDLRCTESRAEIQRICSCCESDVNGIKIYALNDCNLQLSEEQLSALEHAEDDSIVFMHHPIALFSQPYQDQLLHWQEQHKKTMLFYGHRHESKVDGTTVSLQALDPDKAIGECPCLTYYDTDTKQLRKTHYISPVPDDFYDYFGICCYDPLKHIDFCIEKGLKFLELKPECVHCDHTALLEKVTAWRNRGGENLSIHLNDVKYDNGSIKADEIDRLMQLANLLKADRFTQHVPCVSVGTVQADPTVLEDICRFLGQKYSIVEHKMVIGVENMHMTAGEKDDGARRFGYLPEECLSFMHTLKGMCSHIVGINFDIGHARNNIPFSQTYQISTWLSQIGKYAVGYHIHQVTLENGKYSNHMPITDIYGKLISYCSLFKYWTKGTINKAPIIFEMRHEGAYETTLKTFDLQRAKKEDSV